MRLPGTVPTQPNVNEPVIPKADTPAKPAIVIDPIQLVFMVINKWPIIVLTTFKLEYEFLIFFNR